MSEITKAFDQKHGGERYSDGEFYYFADGSVRDVNPLGLLLSCEQLNVRDPEQEFKLAANKLRFAELKRDKAKKAFDELHTRLSHFRPANESEELARLRELQKTVQALTEEVKKAEAVLGKTQRARARAAFKKFEAEEQQRIADYQKKLQSLRV